MGRQTHLHLKEMAKDPLSPLGGWVFVLCFGFGSRKNSYKEKHSHSRSGGGAASPAGGGQPLGAVLGSRTSARQTAAPSLVT